ncbi:MAG TPA: DUF3502 domain-containing protein [Bacillota bacterium]|nr:DUF3502 domain-containing protein [Bacillota bacterium]
MKRKIRKIVGCFLILFLVLLIGCCDKSSDLKVNDRETPQESLVNETLEPAKTEGPYIESRPSIVYLFPSDYPVSDDVSSAINKYLHGLGTEYSVDFIKLDEHNYVDNLTSYLASDKQCDILYTGMPWDNGYDLLVKRDCLQGFNEYLETENGQMLKSSLPNDVWYALERNYEIYGVDGYPWQISSPPSYMVNAELMDKYGLTEDDFKKPLIELTDIFTTVKKGEGEDFYPLWSSIAFNLSSIPRISNAVIMNRNTYKAGLLLDSEEYLEILKALYHMHELGHMPPADISKSNRNLDTFLIKFLFTTDFPYALPDTKSITKNSRVATHEDALTISLDEYGWYGQKKTSCTAINTKSTNKEWAFDFLTKVYTDTKLSNLLLFGIEGEHYETEDEMIQLSGAKFDMNNWLVYGNSFIASPLEYEFKNKTELYMDLHNQAELDPLCRFIFDDSEVSDIISETNECMKNVDRIFRVRLFEEGADFDDVIDGIRQELYVAGVQTLIDEANAQIDEFLKTQ